MIIPTKHDSPRSIGQGFVPLRLAAREGVVVLHPGLNKEGEGRVVVCHGAPVGMRFMSCAAADLCEGSGCIVQVAWWREGTG